MTYVESLNQIIKYLLKNMCLSCFIILTSTRRKIKISYPRIFLFSNRYYWIGSYPKMFWRLWNRYPSLFYLRINDKKYITEKSRKYSKMPIRKWNHQHLSFINVFLKNFQIFFYNWISKLGRTINCSISWHNLWRNF